MLDNLKQLLLAIIIVAPFIYGIVTSNRDLQLVGAEVIGVCAAVWIGFTMRRWNNV
jgi:hypothetical protein